MEILAYVLVGAGAYLLGSIPTGYIVARAKGIDIRTVGSGNIGATNAFRVLGRPAGTFVLAADALKGCVAVFVAAFFGPILGQVPAEQAAAASEYFQITGGIAVILGHNYTCWLKFKGGKGIATSAGVLLALLPKSLAVALSTWIVVFSLSRYVSLGSLAAAAVLPAATWYFYSSPPLRWVSALMGALAIYKHKANIQRLLKGTENRFGKPKATTAGKEGAA